MQVCKRWSNIIHSEIGLTVYVGKGLVYNFPGHKAIRWMPIEVLTSAGIRKCHFGELMEATATDNYSGVNDAITSDEANENAPPQGFMLPELVKELSFYGRISNKLFHVILSPVYWLTTLKIHLMVFRLVSFDKYTLKLCRLTHLRIFYTHPVFQLSFPFNADDPQGKESVHKNLTTFLSTSFFRRIKIFEFVGPYFMDETENFIDAVRAFVTRHDVSLKELVVSFPYEWNVEFGMRKKQENQLSPGLLSSSLRYAKGSAIQPSMRNDWGNVKLDRLVISCPNTIVPPIIANAFNVPLEGEAVSSWSRKTLNSVWQALLKKQCRLKMMQYINKYEDWSFPKAMFQNNAESLKVISLSVNSLFPLDCKALAECKNLAKLSLEGNYFHNNYHSNHVRGRRDENYNYLPGNYAAVGENKENINVSRLFNVRFLPESLQEICLSKVLVPVSEVETLVDATQTKLFPNMKSLQLYQICKGLPQFGLSTDAVQHLFDQSNLSVSFWQALNRVSFEGSIRKALNKVIDPEVMTLMKVLDHCDTDDWMHARNVQFSTLNECHVQLIRKFKRQSKTMR